MKRTAKNREASQRLARDDFSPSLGSGRLVEAGALATAASAMAIGTLHARERQADARDEQPKPTVEPQSDTAENEVGADAGAREPPAQHDRQAPSGEAARPTDDIPQAADHDANTADTIWDPSALTARIAEQIASSVGHVLDMAGGGGGTPQTLSRDIVEQAQHIAREVHGQFAAKEPLAVLADLVPQTVDTLGDDIIGSVDDALTQSGVMDLLNGAALAADPAGIVGDIVADLNGLTLPVDVSALVSEPLETVSDIAGSLLGGVDQGKNPLADLFYDDGGADIAQSIVGEALGSVSDLVTEIPDIGFLGQPLGLGEELGGLTHGGNALQVL